jgi:shikimate kinase
MVLPLSERNLILTGYIGPKQPLLGRQIAEHLRMPLVHIDTIISERYNTSVEDIRAYYGETRLKNIEAEILQESILRRNTVIRVSARTLLQGDYLSRLRETGPVICLVTTLDAMLQRLHIAMGSRYYNPDERALEMAEVRRQWAVRGMEGIHELDTTMMHDSEIVENVITLWRELAIVRV